MHSCLSGHCCASSPARAGTAPRTAYLAIRILLSMSCTVNLSCRACSVKNQGISNGAISPSDVHQIIYQDTCVASSCSAISAASSRPWTRSMFAPWLQQQMSVLVRKVQQPQVVSPKVVQGFLRKNVVLACPTFSYSPIFCLIPKISCVTFNVSVENHSKVHGACFLHQFPWLDA